MTILKYRDIGGTYMKLIVILFMFNSFIFASLIEVYRIGGINAVQKQLDKIIQTKSYWGEYLKNHDVTYGYYESIDSVLICNKNKKDLVLYKKNNNKFNKSFSTSVFIGKANGDKQKEGDLKTPVGVYKLTQKLTKIDSFYGPLALVTSYPNLYDKVKKKSGSGIWIHGLPVDEKRDDFTKGCVALENGKLKELNSKIDYKKAIILFSEKELRTTTRDDISNILSQIYMWKDAWQKGNIKEYLSFYDKNFKQVKGMTLHKFRQRKARIFKRTSYKKIRLTNINISPYANKNKKALFKIVMDEDYKAKYYKFNGKKELYIELKKNGKISILTES